MLIDHYRLKKTPCLIDVDWLLQGIALPGLMMFNGDDDNP
jgi:hypothetical protein